MIPIKHTTFNKFVYFISSKKMPRKSCRSKKTGRFVSCRKSSTKSRKSACRGEGTAKPLTEHEQGCLDEIMQCPLTPPDSSGRLCYVLNPIKWYNRASGKVLTKSEVLDMAFSDSPVNKDLRTQFEQCITKNPITNPKLTKIVKEKVLTCQIDALLTYYKEKSPENPKSRQNAKKALCTFDNYSIKSTK